jgi:2-succinyl-5-enolpyruvyl-6-hydroxy-3-cyclohexene-1-carboxylate synthase
VNNRILKINRNILWAELFVDELARQGIKYACISPGSRSTPLVYALARHNGIKTLSHIDERSGSFFALGLAKRLQVPVVIACTSGTAAAEFYPAIIEAYQSQTPLIVVTADRPPELIDCGANQTIYQENIYTNHINWFSNTGLPELTNDRLLHIKAIARRAVAESNGYTKGPVHINMPFRKPFEPNTVTDEIDEEIINEVRQSAGVPLGYPGSSPDTAYITKIASVIKESARGLFVVGPGYYDSAFSTAIIKLAGILKYPILADGGSQLRHGNFDKSMVCTEYDAYLKVDAFAKMHTPDLIVQFGMGSSSKGLEGYLSKIPTRRFHINPAGKWIDQSGYLDTVIRCDPTVFCRLLSDYYENRPIENRSNVWANAFIKAETISSSVRQRLVDCTSELFEGKVLRMVFDTIPDNTQVLVSNSMPIRDLEYFVSATEKSVSIFTNRGASGIDGITSTALGLAFDAGKPTVLVTGDLAFYHDMNGLLASLRFSIPLIVVLINNNGGGIFRMLPIADYPEVLTEYFITPHNLDFEPFVSGYDGIYKKISNWSDFQAELSDAINRKRLTVLDIPTDPTESTKLRKTYWKEVEIEITKLF